ncbi:MAG: RHS repeat-associated core domain-containing protein [Nitrospira sp.]|nr:RHS repeat-associated core domain-containing protein [Nitrospira sp.]
MRVSHHLRWGTKAQECEKFFGKPLFFAPDGTPRAESAYGVRFLFTGREYLAPVGLYDYRHRAYSPTLGRFLQPDPIGFASGDVNLYRYCANTPVIIVDPDGRTPWMLIGGAIGGGLDLAVQLAQGRSLSEVNWVSVGAGAVSGAVGAGLGASVARLTASITVRAALNAVGSAAIGAGVQTARNAIEGNKLGAGVGSAAVVSGVLGGVGSATGDLIERGVVSMSQNSRFIQSLLDGGSLEATRRGYLLPGEVLPPSAGSTAGTAVGIGISNLGPLFSASSSEPCK